MNKVNVLIVDDRPQNISALSNLIQSDDVNILAAPSAEKALDLLVSNDCALALLDVQMPGTSGFELARLIRGVKRFRNLPIIFVTAHQQERSVIFEGYETGAVDLLFKPLDPYVVRSKVKVFVQMAQQAQMLQDKMAEVEKLRQESEGASLAKSRFLANMSHEIRTPLAAVLGFSDVIGTEGISEKEKRDSLAALKRNGQLLLKIIDDILDLSKVEAGRMDFEHTAFNMRETVGDVEAVMRIRAQEKGIELKVELDPEVQAQFRSDPIRIKQVLLNLIGNAIKFTSRGSVSVRGLRAGSDHVAFTIKDTGIGLSEAQAARLFQPFSQADSSTARIFGGTGLGLSISRRIARALGGDVRLRAFKAGEGCEFEFSFRAPAADTVQLIPAAPASARVSGLPLSWEGKAILVVDDSEDNRSLIELYLKSTGITVRQAASGAEALTSVRDKAPDVILMDIQMPEKDGHQTTRELRQLGVTRPIIAFTAHAMREEAERCRQSGCDLVLTKPISRDKLIGSLSQFL